MPTSNSFAADSTVRFSDRVEAYLAGRPRYPAAIVDDLARRAALTPQAVIADVGVGTGLSAEPFLASGYRVIGVEPNAAMRAAGLEFLSRYPRYECRDGSADATGIDAASVDVVIAAQAFHWFDPGHFRAESLRILKPGGWAALIWNDRDIRGTAFLAGYEALLVEYGQDYRAIRYRHEGTEAIPVYFGGTAPAAVRVPPHAPDGPAGRVGSGRIGLVSAGTGPATARRDDVGTRTAFRGECAAGRSRDALHLPRARGAAGRA